MGCDEVQTHFADHLAGTLPPDVAEDVAAHLRTCSACAAELEALDETWQMLGTVPGERPDSPGMRARFSAMLAGYQEGTGPAKAGLHVLTNRALRNHGLRAWPSPVRYAAWMATAAALLIVGVAVGRQTAPSPAADPQIASLRDELRDMREMMTLSLLQQQSASERLKGAAWASQIDQAGSALTVALLDVLMHDPNDNVRLRTVDALRQFADHEAVRRGAIQALSQQTSPLVQIALIDFVLEVSGREATDALRTLSGDPMVNEAVRARAAQGLARLGA